MPMLSYGGTVMLTVMVGFGLVQFVRVLPLCGGHEREGDVRLADLVSKHLEIGPMPRSRGSEDMRDVGPVRRFAAGVIEA